MSIETLVVGVSPRLPRLAWIFLWVAVGVNAGYAAKRCDWHAPKAVSGETVYRKCLDLAALAEKTLDLPKNVTRISQDGFSICPNAYKTESGGDADILYLLDNSGSMWTGEVNSVYRSCAGDPFERRDEVLIQGLRLQSQLGSRTSAGFIPFDANQQLQTRFVLEPLDITASSPRSAQNIQTLTTAMASSVSQNHTDNDDPCQDFRDELLKQAAVEKAMATYWTQPLQKAIDWRADNELFKASANPAIILVSDGAISDWENVKRLIPQLPRVYGIHMGYRLNRDRNADIASLQLDTLTRLTGGRFYRVSPTDTTTMHKVMEEIIRSVVSSPLPKSIRAENLSLSPPQVSTGKTLRANPDSSLGISLDSILALKEGLNRVKIDLTLNDATQRSYTVQFQVSGAEAGRNAEGHTCYDLPTLEMLDAAGKPPLLYTGDAASYTVRLTRSPSELLGVTVVAKSSDSTRPDAASWGDRESVPMPSPSLALGIPEHKRAFPFTGRSDVPRPGNGVLESNQAGSLTLTWAHPRDAREWAIYVLPGKIIPVLDPVGELIPPKDPARGPESITGLTPQSPLIILSRAPAGEGLPPGACVSGCEVIQTTGVTPGQIPTWTLPVNAPFEFGFKVFDTFGQFINSGEGEFTQAQFDAVRENTDTAKVALSFVPVARQGQHLGTGAYIMQLEVRTRGEVITRNAAGDEVRVRSTRMQQTRRFGYVRQGN